MTNQFTPKGVLFDLDGVLVDTEPTYTRIWEAIETKYPTGVPDFAHVIKGNTLPRILETYYPTQELRDLVTIELKKYENMMDYPVFDGVIEFLQQLKNAGISTAIVTSSNDIKMQQLAQQHPDFIAYFDAIITDSCVEHSKPHPDPYIKGAQALGVPSESCIVFEDSYAGLRSGNDAGAKVIAVASSNPREELAKQAHAVIDNFVGLTLDKVINLLNS